MTAKRKRTVAPLPRRVGNEPYCVSFGEAGRQLSRSVRSVQRYIRKGELRTTIINGVPMVLTASVREFVERGLH